MTDAFGLNNYRCLPPMIPSIYATYEVNMSRTFWAITSHQSHIRYQ